MTHFSRRDTLAALAALGATAWAPRIARAAAIPAPDREAMIPVEGGRIYARVHGKVSSARPPLLCIHGGPGSEHSPYLTLLPLVTDRALIFYDQLDSGRSDIPNDSKNWRVARFVDEIDPIRRAFGAERLHVMGHSWGGTIALEYAARRPAGLASTVLASPLISTRSWIGDANLLRRQLPPATQATLDKCETASPPPEAQCTAATDEFYANFLLRGTQPAEIAAYSRASPGLPFNQKIYEAMWGKTEFVSTGSLKDYDGEPLLAKLDGPRTLFLGGQYDEARPETLGSFAQRVPGAEFAVVPGAGHATVLDRPEECVALLRGWMRRHDQA